MANENSIPSVATANENSAGNPLQQLRQHKPFIPTLPQHVVVSGESQATSLSPLMMMTCPLPATTEESQPSSASSSTKSLLPAAMEASSNLQTEVRHGLEKEALSSGARIPAELIPPPQRPLCLTNPSHGVANDGIDNCEGHLIVYENDILSIAKQSVRTVMQQCSDDETSSSLLQQEHYQVQSLLGQGTFAQVFQCLHRPSNKLVAVKIVKNKTDYTKQALTEVEVYLTLFPRSSAPTRREKLDDYNMSNLQCFFLYKGHLCLVFELLGLNLYQLIKKRQFRGLALPLVQKIARQSLETLHAFSRNKIVHCDIKPENILLVGRQGEDEVVQRIVDTGGTQSSCPASSKPIEGESIRDRSDRVIKLIDFGSACFEGETEPFTYIQSRFYRSPENLLGLRAPFSNYAAMDLWSLGCVLAELFLGLPILPGAHEHDQLTRLTEMIGPLPDWMLEHGSKTTNYYYPTSGADGRTSWRLKSHNEYVDSAMSHGEVECRGGRGKLLQRVTKRLFAQSKLADILVDFHAAARPSSSEDDLYQILAFAQFLNGVLDTNPWTRWTAFQALQHPFITGETDATLRAVANTMQRTSTEDVAFSMGGAKQCLNFLPKWHAPWDPVLQQKKMRRLQQSEAPQQQQFQRPVPSACPRQSQPQEVPLYQQHVMMHEAQRQQLGLPLLTVPTRLDVVPPRVSDNTMPVGMKIVTPSNVPVSVDQQSLQYWCLPQRQPVAASKFCQSASLTSIQATAASDSRRARMHGGHQQRDSSADDDDDDDHADLLIGTAHSFSDAASNQRRPSNGHRRVVGQNEVNFTYALNRPAAVPTGAYGPAVNLPSSLELTEQQWAELQNKALHNHYSGGGISPDNMSYSPHAVTPDAVPMLVSALPMYPDDGKSDGDMSALHAPMDAATIAPSLAMYSYSGGAYGKQQLRGVTQQQQHQQPPLHLTEDCVAPGTVGDSSQRRPSRLHPHRHP